MTANGQTRFAFVPADEGDQEVAALCSDAELMAYLAECETRARTRPRKSLRPIRERYANPDRDPVPVTETPWTRTPPHEAAIKIGLTIAATTDPWGRFSSPSGT